MRGRAWHAGAGAGGVDIGAAAVGTVGGGDGCEVGGAAGGRGKGRGASKAPPGGEGGLFYGEGDEGRG